MVSWWVFHQFLEGVGKWGRMKERSYAEPWIFWFKNYVNICRMLGWYKLLARFSYFLSIFRKQYLLAGNITLFLFDMK